MLPNSNLSHTSYLSYLLEHPKRSLQHPFLQSWPNLSQYHEPRSIFSQHQAFAHPPSIIITISSFGPTQLEEEAITQSPYPLAYKLLNIPKSFIPNHPFSLGLDMDFYFIHTIFLPSWLHPHKKSLYFNYLFPYRR